MERRRIVAWWPAASAVVLSVAALLEVGVHPAERPEMVTVGALLALGMTAPLALVPLWPVLAAALSGGAALLSLVTGSHLTVGGLIALGILYAVAGLRRPVTIVVWLVVPFGIAAVLPSELLVSGRGAALGLLALATSSAAAGTAWRLDRANRRRDAVAHAAQDSLLEHVARGERARIARELHDVVAHHISLIAVQAEAARLTTPGLPPEGEKRLLAIGDTARTALAEMRRLLGVLREDADATAEPTRRPQPGLRQLNDLLDEVRAHGSSGARLIVRGHVTALDEGLELTAYRIVQEALTNVRRHAEGAAVDVELDYRDDELLVRIRDNGPGPSPTTDGDSGHGLAGMRERVAMAGGRLETGPGPAGGFVVEASLPRGERP